MADQTVRTIYEARVASAQADLRRLAQDTDKAASSADKLTDGLARAGSQKIDVDIAQAERAVEALSSEVEALAKDPRVVDIDANIAGADKKRAKLEQELEVLSRMDPTVQVAADVAKAESNLDEVNQRLDILDGMRAEAVATVDADTRQAQSALDDAQSRLDRLNGERAEITVTVDEDSVEGTLDSIGDEAEDAGSDAGARAGESLLEGLNSTPVVGALAGIVAAIGAYIGAGVIDEILDSMKREDLLGARMGLDEATARKVGVAAGAAYANAWGESIDENIGTAESALENRLVDSDATGREIQNVIEQLSAVSEIMDVDVTEAAEAAGNMIKNGLAANAEEAFDIIINGQQEGLNRSEDWIDTLREYSSMFESLGLTGAEAGGLIDQAMDAGARNSDVAADALKEFSIRAQDGSKTTNQAFKDLGLNADDMGAAFAKGGEDAKTGLDTVLDALRGVTGEQDRNQIGAALFGTMWEDMGNGAGVLAFDLDDLGNSWVNVGDTAEDAMARMGDNASTKLETVKRDITTAATNLLGGLASSLEEPIAAASDYVGTHSAEIVEFLIEVGHTFFDIAHAAVEFAATTVEVLGDVAGSLDGIVSGAGKAVEAVGHLSGDQDMIDLGKSIQDAADDMTDFSEEADGIADTMRTTVGGALDDAEEKFDQWSGPALMQAELDDAVAVMVSRLDEFSAFVDESGGTVTINGETLTAEEALNSLITEVDASDGSVTINGESVPADQALDRLMGEIDSSSGTVTIKGNKSAATEAVSAAVAVANAASGEINVDADTANANSKINNAARDRNMTIHVGYSDPGFKGSGGSSSGFAHGGRIPRGLATGGTVGSGYGIVPGPSAPWGVDNVAWPLLGAATGRVLSQPLAGGEWVVNPISSRQHDRVLADINAGATRAELAASLGAQTGRNFELTQNITGSDPYEAAALAVEGTKHYVNSQSTGYRGG